MSNVITISNISSLKALTGMSNQDLAEVSGYYSEADGGGGLFIYDSGGSLTPDNGAVIQPNSPTPGRWLRVLAGQGGTGTPGGGPAGAVSVKWWGAKGTGSSGDATTNVGAFNAAIAYAWALLTSNGSPGTVYIPSGTYYINDIVKIMGSTSGTVAILGEGPVNTFVIWSGSNSSSMFQAYPAAANGSLNTGGSLQRWSIKRLSLAGGGSSITGVICLDLWTLTNGVSPNVGSTSRGVAEEVIFWSAPGGYGLKVRGWSNSYRDCQAIGCGVGFYLESANGCVMERCYANGCGAYGSGAPIQIGDGAGLFINATWENNYGPVLLDGATGCTLYNCYSEANGSTSSGQATQNTQLVVGGISLCKNVTIIGGNFLGGTPPTPSGPPPYDQYAFEFVNVDGYSIINPYVNTHSQLVLRVNSSPSTGMGPNPGVVSFAHLHADWMDSPNAIIVDQIVNYFPNPNFDNGKDNLACWTQTVAGGASATLYNSSTGGYSAANVRYGQNSIFFTGPSTTAYAYVQFALPAYLYNILAGKSIRVVALVKLGSSYLTNGLVPVLSLDSYCNSGWSASGYGPDWIFLVTAPGTLPSSLSSLAVQLSGCNGNQTMGASDSMYIDSIWIVPSNVSTQSLLCGNISTLDCAKWPVYRTYAGSPSTHLTPLYIGEEVLDTTNNAWYKAIGTGNTNWQAL